jgi:hypothetical protein
VDGSSAVEDPLALTDEAVDGARLAVAHLHVRLLVLNRALHRASQRRLDDLSGAAPVGVASPFPDLLRRVERVAQLPGERVPTWGFEPDDLDAEAQLRALASPTDVVLPLDRLATRFGLTELDQLVLVAVIAWDLDPAYGQLYRELVGWEEPVATVAAVLSVTDGVADWPQRRMAIGPHGRLRRHGLIATSGDLAGDLHTVLFPTPGLLDLMLGAKVDPGALGRDAGALTSPAVIVRADDWHRLEPLVGGLGTGTVDTLGLRSASSSPG